MVAYLPIAGGHIRLAERFVDPSFSFTLGWNYTYHWLLSLPAELSAASVLISFWEPVSRSLFHSDYLAQKFQVTKVNPAAWVTMCIVVVIFINLLGAGRLSLQ